MSPLDWKDTYSWLSSAGDDAKLLNQKLLDYVEWYRRYTAVAPELILEGLRKEEPWRTDSHPALSSGICLSDMIQTNQVFWKS